MSDLKEKIKAAQIDLIKELGIDKLDQEQKEKLIMDIGQILQERIALRVTEELPEEKIEEFKAILDKAETDPAQLDQFLKENIPGIEDLILEETRRRETTRRRTTNRGTTNRTIGRKNRASRSRTTSASRTIGKTRISRSG